MYKYMCIWYVNCLLHGKFKNKNIAKTNGAVINFLLFFTFSSRFQIFQTNHFIFTNSKKIIIIMYRFKIRRTKQNYGQIKFNCIHLLLKSEMITITKSNLLKTWMYTFNVRKSVLFYFQLLCLIKNLYIAHYSSVTLGYTRNWRLFSIKIVK